MKAAIIYASVHHENTKKVVEAIAGENVVDLIDATTVYNTHLTLPKKSLL